jgi:hypothetical protein
MRWQENVEHTAGKKKVASVASLNQLVQHEEKKNHSQLGPKKIVNAYVPMILLLSVISIEIFRKQCACI